MAANLTVNTNSYISVANAQLYFDNRLYVTAWTTASADDKAKALIMATRNIDRLTLVGRKYDSDQTLQFPRCYVSDTRFAGVDNQANVNIAGDGWYCEQEVPQPVLDAVCEESLALLTNGNDTRRQMQAAGVKSFTLGSLSETFADAANSTTKAGALISPEAKALMKPYIAGAVRII